MKIVAIAGSPRKRGNSTSLMQVAVDAAVKRGATASVFYPVEMSIVGCYGCGHCQKALDGACRTKDDMQSIYETIKACDALVLASPVYFYGLSSWLKEVIDRCFALIDPPEPPGGTAAGAPPAHRVEPGKSLYLITTQHAEWPMFGYQILSTVVNGFRWLGMECRGQIIATDLGEPDDWKRRPDLIAAAEGLIRMGDTRSVR